MKDKTIKNKIQPEQNKTIKKTRQDQEQIKTRRRQEKTRQEQYNARA
jgi:hypothetical protein